MSSKYVVKFIRCLLGFGCVGLLMSLTMGPYMVYMFPPYYGLGETFMGAWFEKAILMTWFWLIIGFFAGIIEVVNEKCLRNT